VEICSDGFWGLGGRSGNSVGLGQAMAGLADSMFGLNNFCIPRYSSRSDAPSVLFDF